MAVRQEDADALAAGAREFVAGKGEGADVELLMEDLADQAKSSGVTIDQEELQRIAAPVVLEEKVRHVIHVGYGERDEIVEDIAEWLRDYGITYDTDEIASIVDARWAARLAEQGGWPEVTDNDLLERAFDQLESDGIVAREHFTCCQNCGTAEIGAEVDEGSTVDGYAFFHEQDTTGPWPATRC
jgi:uncharacterized protein DUF6891